MIHWFSNSAKKYKSISITKFGSYLILRKTKKPTMLISENHRKTAKAQWFKLLCVEYQIEL